MRIGRWRFAPPVWASLLAISVCATAVFLGNWQTGRAEGKLAQQARLDALASAPALSINGADALALSAGNLVNRRLAARGRLLHERGWLIDNRIHHGRPGYHVVTPLLLEGSTGAPRVLLVNRGWIAAPARRDEVPAIPAPDGVLEVEGAGIAVPARAYELAKDDGAGRVRQNLLLERAQAELGATLAGVSVLPVVLQQSGGSATATNDGLARDWPRVDARADVNRAYALQWYALALLALAIWAGMNLKREA